MKKAQSGAGFIAALDQSGGSTPKALKLYGIPEDAYSGDEQMFDLVHEMRTRIITSPAFDGDRIMGAILFEMTMDREIEGRPTADYLWNVKNVVPFLKIDKGLADEQDGAQTMKPMPGLDDLLDRAVANGVFGTKERSVIKLPGAGLDAVVAQQFEVGQQVLAKGLVPIIEPEVDIKSPKKAEAEDQLNAALLDGVNTLGDDQKVMLKLTLPDTDNLYKQLVDHPKVLRVVALSGGYSRDEACEKLARNTGVIASFSRALTEGLTAQQSDEEFNATLDAGDREHRQGVELPDVDPGLRGGAGRRRACLRWPFPPRRGGGWRGSGWFRCCSSSARHRPQRRAADGLARYGRVRAGEPILAVAQRGAAAGRVRGRGRRVVVPMGMGGASAALRRADGPTDAHRGRRTPLGLGDRRGRAVVAPPRRTVGAARAPRNGISRRRSRLHRWAAYGWSASWWSPSTPRSWGRSCCAPGACGRCPVVLAVLGPAWFWWGPAPVPGSTVRVALVQPGDIAEATARQAASESLTEGLAGQRLDLVVWGESSVGVDLTSHPDTAGSPGRTAPTGRGGRVGQRRRTGPRRRDLQIVGAHRRRRPARFVCEDAAGAVRRVRAAAAAARLGHSSHQGGRRGPPTR